MSYANADYISFVDADDWLDVECYSVLYDRIERADEKWDMVCGTTVREEYGAYGSNDVGGAPGSGKEYEFHFEVKNGFCWGNIPNRLESGEIYRNAGSLLRRQLLNENGIAFPEGMSYEDNYFFGVLKLYLQHCCVLDRGLYHYLMNPQSTTNADSDRQMDRLKIEMMLLEQYARLGALRVYYMEIAGDFLMRYWLNSWNIFFTRLSDTPSPGLYMDMRTTVNEYFPGWKAMFDMDRLKERMPEAWLLLHWLESDETVDEEKMQEKRAEYLKYR